MLLAFLFLIGFSAGGFLYLCPENSSYLWMDGLLSRSVSIVGLGSVLLLPFLFSAFAVSSGQNWILFVVAFAKGFSVSFVSCGILCAYGDGGWLAMLLLMFSEWMMLPVLWLFWLRNIDHQTAPAYSGTIFWIALIGSLDYFIISPFGASL